jgi:arylsulfatase A-like enzyme/Tfp pilus assembly protein PilF
MPTMTSRAQRVALAAAVLAVLALAALWAARAGRPGRWLGARPRNLLVVTLDTLRADRVGAYGYAAALTPRLDGLAARGLRFARASTVVPLTLPAHSSLFTGTFPARHGVRDNGGFYLPDEQVTLAELLRERGYRTGGFVSSFVLDGRWGIQQGFDRYFDDFDLAAFKEAPGMDAIQRPGTQTVDEALRWLGEDRTRPFFAWVHLYDPHAPYEPPEPYASRFPATASGAYDGEIAATDALVGRVLDALEADGRLRDTLVVAVGDHGEMLGEHGEQTHGFFVYEAATHIPLIVAGPAVPSRVVEAPVRIVDVMPTLLDLLGVPPPPAIQGASLLPLARGERLDLLAVSESWYPRYHYGWSELVAVQDGRYKLIRAPRTELYDLREDPREAVNLASQESRRAEAMERALQALEASQGAGAATHKPAAMDADTAEKLEALGYVAGGFSAKHLEERPRGDPKDKIGLYNLLKQAGGASAAGRVDDAIAKVSQALADDPEILEGHMLLGNFLRKARRPEEALRAYRRALALDPSHDETVFLLAVTYKDMARYQDARVGFERARELDPRNGKVLWQMADVEMREQKWDRAEAILKDALARKVEEERFQLKLGECYLEMKRYDAAEGALRRALAVRPHLETAHFNLGLLYEERGDAVRAMSEYEAELSVNPKGYRASFNLAKLLLKAGRLPEAVTRLEQSVAAAPEFGTGHLYLAKGLLDLGRLDGAETAARKGLESNPDPRMAPLGHYVLADVYNRRGQPARAEAEVAKARRLEGAAPRPPRGV